MKILIAEDDAVSRRLLRGHLEKWGHEVIEAKDGAEAWDLFTRDSGGVTGKGGRSNGDSTGFPVVIVDWMMPLMDGLEFVQRVRARRLPQYTYLLMLTAKNQKEDIVVGMDAGADDYLTKPFDKEELRARLQAGQRILSLQAALLRAEKTAAVGRLATGVAAEIAAPLSEALTTIIELRQDTNALLDHTSVPDLAALSDFPTQVSATVPSHDPDAPPRPAAAPVDLSRIRATLGPRFVAAEHKLQSVRELVRTLRDFARLDDLPTRPLQLSTLVTETVSMLRQEMTAKHLSLDWTERHDLPLVTGNTGKLKRTLYNILTVLTEAAPPGSPIKLSLTKQGTSLHLTLAGPTPSLSPAQSRQLFEPFAQTALVSGLGLPVALSITVEHGGTLEATTTPGGQTSFHLQLPTQ